MKPSSKRATVIALLAASSLLFAPQSFAAGHPKSHGSAHTNIILQHHGHKHAKGGHGHSKGGAHTNIILQHHHRP